MAKLYITATPIGNLGDMTLRAIETLKAVDIIAAEDTRNTLKLLSRFDIKTKLISYHEYSDIKKAQSIIDMVLSGKNVALVSDAGTPAVSDPGASLVALAREQGVEVTPIPGACAAVSAYSVSGVRGGKFIFYGFLESKASQRKKELEKISEYDMPVILYESPHRVIRTLEDIKDICGEKTRITVQRELTKVYEEYICDTAKNIIAILSGREDIKGEFVLIIENAREEKPIDEEDIKKALEQYLKEGKSKKDAAKAVSEKLGIPKNTVYKISLDIN